MVAARPTGGGMPWLGVRMMMFAGILLIITKLDDGAHTFARATIILLWVMTAFAAMLKESMAYGLGDRVTIFGMLLILAISIAAPLFERVHVAFLSVVSLLFAFLVLVQVIANVAARQKAIEPFHAPTPDQP